jgi:hypothetical protein
LAKSDLAATDSPDGPGRGPLHHGVSRQNLENPVRERSKFVRRFNADSTVQSRSEKYYASVFRKYVISSRHPASIVEGVLANRHKA